MIKFGTDGWRAIISDEFTFDNVRRVAKAIAFYLLNSKLKSQNSKLNEVIIGYDARFLADRFAIEMAKVMEDAGINCLLTERDTPTPVVAWEVRDRKAAGAIVLTASHNPPEYCGIKFIPHYAGPADESITKVLQEYSNQEIDLPKPNKKGEVERFDPRERYLKYLETYLDKKLICSAKLKVVYDPMFGVGRGYMDKMLEEFGCDLQVIHGYRDVLFGGKNPEPDGEYLDELKQAVIKNKANVGLANDGDADRFGVVDENGVFFNANQLLPLVFNYLITEKGYKGSVVRSAATSHFIDRIAKAHNIKIHETPVGFKYIAQIMMKEPVIVGGEESGGLSIKGHIPEKDGILANMLIVEMMAKTKKPLSKLWDDLIKKYGPVYSIKQNLKLDDDSKQALMSKINDLPPLTGGAWFLCRPSGTEPIVRLYVEAATKDEADQIVKTIRNLI